MADRDACICQFIEGELLYTQARWDSKLRLLQGFTVVVTMWMVVDEILRRNSLLHCLIGANIFSAPIIFTKGGWR